MTTGRSAAPKILAAAIGLGIAADSLFRAPVWGVNVPVFVFSLAAWTCRLGARTHAGPRSRWPWLAACGFAAMWVFLDTPSLLACDLLAALCLLSFPLIERRGVTLRAAGAVELLLAPARAIGHTVGGAAGLLLRDVKWTETFGPGQLRTMRATAGGLALSVPIVLLFGSLFVSADPTFEGAVGAVFALTAGPVFGHVASTGVAAWLTAGYLRAIVVTRPPDSRAPTQSPVGLIPVAMALAAMVLVFTLFVAAQAGSLFRGEAYVTAHVGLTFAEYARRGFFELVAASALALPVVYVAPHLAGALNAAAERSLRALQSVALGLVALVALSALWRLRLYVDAYGLTEDRLYGSAIIAWIGATIGVFSRTMLAGRPQRTAHGAMLAAVVVLALLNAANPSALIARVNLGRTGTGAVDASYLATLGAEAVPVITARIPEMDAEARCAAAKRLVERWSAEPQGDWRGWNVARARARSALSALGWVAAPCASQQSS